MSISSSLYAEYAERVRIEWVKKLKSAITLPVDDFSKLQAISEVIAEIDEHYFSE